MKRWQLSLVLYVVSIPVSIGLIILASNNRGRREEPIEPDSVRYGNDVRRYAPQQPIFIVVPPQTQMPYDYSQNSRLAVANYATVIPAPANNDALGPREFKIIGDEQP